MKIYLFFLIFILHVHYVRKQVALIGLLCCIHLLTIDQAFTDVSMMLPNQFKNHIYFHFYIYHKYDCIICISR